MFLGEFFAGVCLYNTSRFYVNFSVWGKGYWASKSLLFPTSKSVIIFLEVMRVSSNHLGSELKLFSWVISYTKIAPIALNLRF